MTYESAVPGQSRVITFRTPGDIALGLLEMTPRQPDPRLPPALLIHGATFGAMLFDLPLPSYSLMRALATAGRAVYALDLRGYGHSRGAMAMDGAPHAGAPLCRLDDAVADIDAAVALILTRHDAPALDLIGFSWGSVASARYAGERPARVDRLALYAPLYREINPMWLARIADPRDRNALDPNIGAYRLLTRTDVAERWNHDLPGGDPSRYRKATLPDAVFDAFAALDPGIHANGHPAFRCPSGALADLLEIFNGRRLYDPAALTMPTLLIRGSDDTTSTDSDARHLLAAIAASAKDYVVIDPGSHFLLLENSRSQLYRALERFLAR